MHLEPFLLDRWLTAHQFATPPIRYDLAASTGPAWTFGELLGLGGNSAQQALNALPVSYLPPNGGETLRRRIAELHHVDPDCVVVTTGASEALSALFCVLAEPGATVALGNPMFPAMSVMARAWGLGISTYDLPRERNFEHSVDRILAATDQRTRLAVVNSPHSPTGSVMPKREMAQLAEALADRNVPLMVDEVYHPLYFDAPAATAAGLPNTIVIGDMSKAYSLSGLRIGWLIDRDPARRERVIEARSYFTICGSPLTEALAAMALGEIAAVMSRLEAVARGNLMLLDDFMDAHRDTVAWVRPVGGTTAFPWFIDGRDARPFCEAVAREGVLVAPGDCFDAPDHFRVGFGAQREGFGAALDIVSRVLQN